MEVSDQIQAFGADIDRVIERYIDEFDLPAAALIGVITLIQAQLVERALYVDEDDDDEI